MLLCRKKVKENATKLEKFLNVTSERTKGRTFEWSSGRTDFNMEHKRPTFIALQAYCQLCLNFQQFWEIVKKLNCFGLNFCLLDDF